MKTSDSLLAIALQYCGLSLVAFGGVNAVIPEVQRQAVVVNHWMTDQDFTALFAIAQAAPGPNFLVTTLVGWRVAGLAGAAVATLAMCGPSCLLTYWVAKAWDRYRETEWRIAVGSGLAPVTVGFVFSSAFVLIRAADANWRLALVTGVSAAVAYFSRINPIWCLAAAAALGVAGLLR
ncbi:MAG TPA: chromate transporter [Caulobacteraceae bacterium]|nr:chromate transporter [Caulobacteraceae bacterium]